MSTRRSRQAGTGEAQSEECVDADFDGELGSAEMQMTPAAAEVLAMATAAVAEDLMEDDSDANADADPSAAAAEAAESDPSAAAAAAGEEGGGDSSDDGEQYSFGDMADTDEDEDAFGDAVEFEDDDELEDEDDDDDEDEDDGEDHVEVNLGGVRATLDRGGIMSLLFGRNRAMMAAHEVFRDMPRLPLSLQPLTGDLAATINRASQGRDVGQANPIWGCLDSSCDAIHLDSISTAEALNRHHQRSGFKRVFPPPEPQSGGGADAHADADVSNSSRSSKAAKRHAESAAAAEGRGAGSSLSGAISSIVQAAAAAATSHGGVSTRSSARRRAAAATAAGTAAEPAGDLEAASTAATAAVASSSSNIMGSGHQLTNTACMVFKREVALGRQYGFSRTQQVHMTSRTFPVFPQKVRDHMHSRAYIGQYSGSGDFFIAAYQDRRVRLYDTTRNWALRKDVTTRMTRWTITDTTMSPDQRLLVYASISPVAFVVNVGSSYDVVESQANITEVHEPLAFDGRYAEGADARRANRRGAGSDSDDDWDGGSFGIWSIAWSPQGGQLIAGTNGNAVCVYDIESKRCLTKLTNHQDDVNAVAYLRDDDPHLVVSGSDDSLVRVWDLRDRSGTIRAAQGVLVGHTEGLTHVCPKGDGHHLISNCKDQTIKLWDTRRAVSNSEAYASMRNKPRIPRWDYRWEDYPATGYAVQHPDDVSLMTYRGHAVLQTLVRAYFSPAHSTGQRYIYAGNAEGDILVWDVVTGKQVSKLQYHQSLVRDCSWHPYEPEMTTVSWDGRILSWGVQPPNKPISRYSD